MERARRGWWANYFDHVSNRMGLRDWKVAILEEPCADDNGAECYCVEGRKIINVRLQTGWDEEDEEEQRYCAAHELTHPHFDLAVEFVRVTFNETFNPTAAKEKMANFVRMLEHGIDGMADVIAPLMPLPSEFAARLKEIAPADEPEKGCNCCGGYSYKATDEPVDEPSELILCEACMAVLTPSEREISYSTEIAGRLFTPICGHCAERIYFDKPAKEEINHKTCDCCKHEEEPINEPVEGRGRVKMVCGQCGKATNLLFTNTGGGGSASKCAECIGLPTNTTTISTPADEPAKCSRCSQSFDNKLPVINQRYGVEAICLECNAELNAAPDTAGQTYRFNYPPDAPPEIEPCCNCSRSLNSLQKYQRAVNGTIVRPLCGDCYADYDTSLEAAASEGPLYNCPQCGEAYTSTRTWQSFDGRLICRDCIYALRPKTVANDNGVTQKEQVATTLPQKAYERGANSSNCPYCLEVVTASPDWTWDSDIGAMRHNCQQQQLEAEGVPTVDERAVSPCQCSTEVKMRESLQGRYCCDVSAKWGAEWRRGPTEPHAEEEGLLSTVDGIGACAK